MLLVQQNDYNFKLEIDVYYATKTSGGIEPELFKI